MMTRPNGNYLLRNSFKDQKVSPPHILAVPRSERSPTYRKSNREYHSLRVKRKRPGKLS